MGAPSHLPLVASPVLSGVDGRLEGAQQFIGAEHHATAPVVLHRRDVIRVRGDWYFRCACGFVSTACLTEDAAWTEPCEIETIRAISVMRELALVSR